MPKQMPCLWFDGQAEQAAEHYTAIFPNSRITGVTRVPPGGPGREGDVLTVEFSLDGHSYVGLNGGPQFTFNEAISFQIHCTDQDEVDHYWDRLSEGGEQGPCGWLRDRFGVSWQIIPTALSQMLQDEDPRKAGNVMQAMLQMTKIDIAGLRRAYEEA